MLTIGSTTQISAHLNAEGITTKAVTARRKKPTTASPAQEVEAATVAQIKTVLSRPEAITSVCTNIKHNGTQVDEYSAVMALCRLGHVWEQLYPAERHRIVNLMIERVDLVTGCLKIKWRELGWKALIQVFTPGTIGAEMVELEERG